MDRNFVLACALSLAVLVGWMYLTGDPDRAQRSGGNDPTSVQRIDSITDPLPATARGDSPAPLERAAEPALAALAPEPDQIEVAERQILVEMPLYSVALTNRGAGISSWKLKEFRETSDRASPRIDLVTGGDAGNPLLVTPFHQKRPKSTLKRQAEID